MKTQIFQTFLVGGLMTAAFFFGRGVSHVEAQGGRGPTRPTNPNPEEPVTMSGGRQPLVYESSNGSSSGSANGFIAVTGSYGVGTSVLYLIDTNTRQLAVYEARGGSKSMRRIVLCGARRIDLDLQIEDYNDKSEFDYAVLRKKVEAADRRAARKNAGKAGSAVDRR